MSDIVPLGPQQFFFEDHEVRVVLVDGEPRWIVIDVCEALEIADASVALRRVDEADQCQVPVRSGGQQRLMNAVNESGLYELIFRSDKPAAKRFRRWVTSVVLPEIRKTGGYGRELSRLELAQMVVEAEKERLALASQLDEATERVDRGYFKVRIVAYPDPKGGLTPKSAPQVRVTYKGIAWIHKKLGGTSALDDLIGSGDESEAA